MALGLLFGVIASKFNIQKEVSDWVIPFGVIFMRLLKAIAIPLVFISLVRGVANIGDISTLSKLGTKTFGIYIATTVIAIAIGLSLVLIIAPGKMMDQKSAERIQAQYEAQATEHVSVVHQIEDASPLQWLVDAVPENVTSSASNNGGMLQIILIAVMCGVAILLVGRNRVQAMIDLFDSLDLIILKIVDMIMAFAPIGVFALMAQVIVENAGDLSILASLGMYAITVILGLFILILVFYPLLVKVFARRSPLEFLKKMFPVQLLAFTTSSSAATLPLTMETVQRDLGVRPKIASFVLPVGMTINMDGTSLYQVVGAVFIAQVFGIDLTFGQILIVIATTTISSIGTPAIPGGSIVILMMVLNSIGVPPEGLALILGIDRPLDMLRTAANVTGDAVVCTILDRNSNL